jgi:hypothetical protein
MKIIPNRGLQELRTMSGRISDEDNPQRKYLTMAMLALEKARRGKEKQSANRRAAIIDQRLAEIAAEQAELLAAAETELGAETPKSHKRRGQAGNSDSQSASGFTLNY